MGTSALTEFKSGEKTVFSIYVKDGGHPEDFLPEIVRELNKIKRKANSAGLSILFENMKKTIPVESMEIVYQENGISFNSYGMMNDDSLEKWKLFTEKHPECDYRLKNIGRILKGIFYEPINMLNVCRDLKEGYSHVDCHNIINIDDRTLQVKFYGKKVQTSLNGLTIKKLYEKIKNM